MKNLKNEEQENKANIRNAKLKQNKTCKIKQTITIKQQ